MNVRSVVLAIGIVAQARAQVPAGNPSVSLPRTEAAISAWDLAIVLRAEALIASPAQWNRSDKGDCRADAKTFSLRCALEHATDEAAGRVTGQSSKLVRLDCRMANANGRSEGSCGPLFDESTVFSIAHAKAIATGKWRADAAPTEVWAGRMVNAEGPVLQQARKMVDSIAPGKYRNARLVEFNNDSTVTFDNLQSFFHTLQRRVTQVTPADLTSMADDVEIEVYAGGAGVIRTYNGWYAVSGFAANDTTVRFQMDTSSQIAPNVLDREIVKRADAILSSDAVWNRADNRKCDAAATTWSIYCALEAATREVTGGFHHRRPALETVRVIVEERTKDRNYNHRLMDYNNDKSTRLSDVRTLFAEALAKMNR
jgi:hypothetical protein